MEHQLTYNKRSELILPEYGRNIQKMVEIALKIEDRDERNRCARTIIDSMGNLFPYLRDVETYKHKLWDHLAIMSNFKLDIDYPYEVYEPEKMIKKPNKIEINKEKIKILHYGRSVEGFIKILSENNQINHKEECIMTIANHMKKTYLAWNKDIVDDSQIFEDLKIMSDGKISIDTEVGKLKERDRYYNNYQKKTFKKKA